MGKNKVPSVTKARRLASAYITAWGQYERAEASWASTLSGEAPAGRGFRHSLEAKDLAAAELSAAEHGLARARFAVVQNHCPDWCNAGSRLLSTDHGHSGPLPLAHAIASGREFVHAKHFDDAFGLDLGFANVIAHVSIAQDGRWLRAWVTINPTALDPVDAMLLGRQLAEVGEWLSREMQAHDTFGPAPDALEDPQSAGRGGPASE